MSVPKWNIKEPKWTTKTLSLLHQSKTNLPEVSLQEILERSDNFPTKFPINTCRCKNIRKHLDGYTLNRNINSAYPIVHETALELYCRFILSKRKHGSKPERILYKNMNLKGFINRLLTKRAVSFVNSTDTYQLLSGASGSGKWELIGTDQERYPLLLRDCLSYDELKCSAFLSVSSFTYFINNGNRYNKGTFDRSNVEDEGVIIGIIGPRFEKKNVMEYQEIIVNSGENGSNMMELFLEMYEEERLTYMEILDHKNQMRSGDKILKRYKRLSSQRMFDNHVYSKRLALSFDTLLLEANHRAKIRGTTAFVHVVGFGLGVWKISPHQSRVFMKTFASRLGVLGHHLLNVSDVCFSYIHEEKCGPCTNDQIYPIENHPCQGIKIHIHDREPHEKLSGEHKDKLLVVSYPWDSNALPGNEFWSSFLCGSGDPAAAASTQITELHNSHINPLVSADNLMVATKRGVMDINTFLNKIETF